MTENSSELQAQVMILIKQPTIFLVKTLQLQHNEDKSQNMNYSYTWIRGEIKKEQSKPNNTQQFGDSTSLY